MPKIKIEEMKRRKWMVNEAGEATSTFCQLKGNREREKERRERDRESGERAQI